MLNITSLKNKRKDSSCWKMLSKTNHRTWNYGPLNLVFHFTVSCIFHLNKCRKKNNNVSGTSFCKLQLRKFTWKNEVSVLNHHKMMGFSIFSSINASNKAIKNLNYAKVCFTINESWKVVLRIFLVFSFLKNLKCILWFFLKKATIFEVNYQTFSKVQV